MSAPRWLGPLGAVAIAALGTIAVQAVQPGLAATVHAVKQRDDVFLLPPPDELRVMTLGYRASAVDLLWARLLYEYGLHAQEKRPFPDITRYLDGIIALEPDFPMVYAFVDTMMVFNAPGGTEEDARTARRYLERGTKERSYDPQVWLHYGQFVAFLAPSFLKDEAEIEQWRKDGAMAIAHAVELGADADRSLSASTLLSKAGEQKAAINHLQRAYAMTDDPETRRQITFKLQRLRASEDAELAISLVEQEWHARWMFLSRGTTLLLGPGRDPAACAGPASYERKGCASDWNAFIERAR
jgi:hypothetical protein